MATETEAVNRAWKAAQELLKALRPLPRDARIEAFGLVLDEFCGVCGYLGDGDCDCADGDENPDEYNEEMQ